MIDPTAVGKTIAALRQQKGLSQQALADMCSVTHQAVSKWENGQALPDIQTLLNLSRYFEVSMEDILSGNMPAQSSENVQTVPLSASTPQVELRQPIETSEPEHTAETTDEPPTQDMDWKQILSMLPYASHETVDKLLLDAVRHPQGEKTDARVILSILPFASRPVIEDLATSIMNTEDAHLLPALAPFVSTPFLAELVRKNEALMRGENTSLLQSLIPFLPGDMVDELIPRGAAKRLRWKKKGQNGRMRYDLDIDLGSMHKLQSLGEHMGEVFGALFNTPDPKASVQPEQQPQRERTLMRIARKAVEADNITWLDEHVGDLLDGEKTELCRLILQQDKWHIAMQISDELDSAQRRLFVAEAVRRSQSDWLDNYYDELDYEDQIMVCQLIARAGKWTLIEALDLDVNNEASRILLTAALENNATDAVTRILEMWDADNETLQMLCTHAAQTGSRELIRSLADIVDDEVCLHMLLDAAIEADDWELISLLSENM